MSSTKIAQFSLYIIAGISILVLGFFYVGDSLIDQEAYKAKLAKLEVPAENVPAVATPVPAVDSTAVDSTVVDTVAVNETLPVTTGATPVEEVKFTFMEKLVSNKIDMALIWGYILFIITAIFAVAFPLVQIISHPARLVRALIVFVGVAIFVGLAYMLSSDTPLAIPGFTGTQNSDPVVLKLIDTGLISTYFILGIALLSILYSEVVRYFK